MLYNKFILKTRFYNRFVIYEKLYNFFFGVNFGNFYRFFHILIFKALKEGGKGIALR